MTRLVVDASVVIKWYLPETHSSEADLLLSESFQLLAPELLFSEIGNILWKRVMRSEISIQKAHSIMNAIRKLPLVLQPTALLAESAMSIACGLKRSFYDSLYLAHALLADCKLVTADRKLFEAVINSAPIKKHILWIEDVSVPS